jgi:hypothetical protein
MCLFGFGRWWDEWDYWKVRCLAENIWLETRCFTENIWFESPALGRKYSVVNMINLWKIFGLKLEKYGYLWDYKDWVVDLGRPSAVRRPVFLRHFIPFALIMVLDYATICILSVRLYRF